MLQRDLARLDAGHFDLAIVGGGISGACAAWDAAARGLSVALLEHEDFGHAASANCFKMIHGGIRYLQHADLPRIRESAKERRILLQIAPHLARPLPIFVPTWGRGMRSKELLLTGMKLYDALTADRNRGARDPARRVPATRAVGRDEALARMPFLDGPGFTGGALFHDGQMPNPARLLLAFLQSAAAEGAQLANHVEATGLLRSGERVVGIEARDRLSGELFAVRASVVLNATGGWTPRFLAGALGRPLDPEPTFSRDAFFVTDREPPSDWALAIPGSTRDPDALVSRAARHLFLVPWRGRAIVGVWHTVWRDAPERAAVSEAELESWVAELRDACPGLGIERADVSRVQCGLVLFGENRGGARDLRYGKRSLLIDHARSHGMEGLLTLVGVRYTTARAEAERAVAAAFRKLGRLAPDSPTAQRPLHGGDVPDIAALEREALAGAPEALHASLRDLVANHGSRWRAVLEHARARPELREPLPGSTTLGAEVVHAVREEMALTLEDVALGRTELATAGAPAQAALERAAKLAGEALGWSDARCRQELDACAAAVVAPGALGGSAAA